MRYPQELKDEIRERVDFVALVSETVRLRKAGSKYQGLCPFHKEKSPSFSVNPEKGIFYCFGCKEGGDAFRFVMRRDGLSFPRALERLATLAAVDMSRYEDSGNTAAPTKRLKEAIVAAQEIFVESLEIDSEPWDYLTKKRGLSDETIRTFGIGFAPDTWTHVTERLQRRGFSQEELLMAGLSRTRESGGSYDAFRNRVTFPIHDDRGQVVAFGARTMGDSTPKYLNSPETPIFKKGRLLYNLNRLDPKDTQGVVLVEGYMDCVGLWQVGVKNSVATLGTALTPMHVRRLGRFTDRLFLSFDADAAGLKATLRSLELLQDAELSVSVLDLPGGVDPDELVKTQGIEGWRAQIEEAQSIGGFLFSTTVAQHDLETAEGRRRAIIELKEAFPLLPNVESKDRFIKQAAERFGLTDELVRQSFLRHRESDRMVYEVQSQEVNEKVSPTVMKERYLLAHFLNDLEVFRRTRREFEDGDFTDSTCRRVLELLAKLENAAGSPAETLISLTDDEEIQRFVARESMSHPLPEENQEEDVRQCLQALRRDNLDRELRRLRTKIRDEPNADLKVAMQKEANVLRRRLVQSRSENSWR